MGLNIAVGIEIFYPQINGVITSTMTLISHLRESGHNVVIVTPKVMKNPPQEVQDIPVEYIPSTSALTYPGLRLVNTRSTIFRDIIEKYDIDIIHSTAPWFTCLGLQRAAKKLSIPVVNTFHTNLLDPGYIQYIAPLIMNKYTIKILQASVWQASKPFLNTSDIVVAPSPETCSAIRKIYHKKRIEWIPNGVQIDLFKEPQDTNLLYGLIPNIKQEHQSYAIFIGRMAKEKSVALLIQATAIVVKSVPDFMLVLIGDGPKRIDYTKLAKTLGVEHHTKFLGKIDNNLILKSGILKLAKFFTTASTTETHSMTVTEALCCGIPVVVANHPSMTYLTETTGLHFEPNNPESLAEKIITMWTNPKIYQRLKSEAAKKIDEFNSAEVAQRYMNLYTEILSQKRKNN